MQIAPASVAIILIADFLKNNCMMSDSVTNLATAHYSSDKTVTDFGSTVKLIRSVFTVTVIGFGMTVPGASKVFTLSTAGAVSVSPLADLIVTPVTTRSISIDRKSVV